MLQIHCVNPDPALQQILLWCPGPLGTDLSQSWSKPLATNTTLVPKFTWPKPDLARPTERQRPLSHDPLKLAIFVQAQHCNKSHFQAQTHLAQLKCSQTH